MTKDTSSEPISIDQLQRNLIANNQLEPCENLLWIGLDNLWRRACILGLIMFTTFSALIIWQSFQRVHGSLIGMIIPMAIIPFFMLYAIHIKRKIYLALSDRRFMCVGIKGKISWWFATKDIKTIEYKDIVQGKSNVKFTFNGRCYVYSNAGNQAKEPFLLKFLYSGIPKYAISQIHEYTIYGVSDAKTLKHFVHKSIQTFPKSNQ